MIVYTTNKKQQRMKKVLLMISGLVLTTGLWAKSPSAASIVNVDAAKSTIEWKGSKYIGGSHNGTVALKEGKLFAAGGELTGAEMVIDMTAIVCTDISNPSSNERLIGHLKSDDFFSVDKYPTATLKITTFEKSENAKAGTHIAKGTLTIKGITKPIAFYTTVNASGGKYTATAEFEVDRSLYDVRFGSNSFFDSLGDKAIKNDIQFKVSLTTK
jgi:polyisoprenoid-binding protein YceI